MSNNWDDWAKSPDTGSVDLGEDALLEAIRAIGQMTKPQAVQLLVTDEGIAYVKVRCREDGEFRAAIKQRADRDADYATFLKLVGVWEMIEGKT